jgi:hypothetical protein
VFLISDHARPTTAVLLAEGRALRDPLSNETIRVDNGRATVSVPAHGVRMLLVD